MDPIEPRDVEKLLAMLDSPEVAEKIRGIVKKTLAVAIDKPVTETFANEVINDEPRENPKTGC